MARLARRRIGAVVLADVRRLPLPAAAVDAVSAVWLLHLLRGDGVVREVVAEAARVLRPGGVFVATVDKDAGHDVGSDIDAVLTPFRSSRPATRRIRSPVTRGPAAWSPSARPASPGTDRGVHRCAPPGRCSGATTPHGSPCPGRPPPGSRPSSPRCPTRTAHGPTPRTGCWPSGRAADRGPNDGAGRGLRGTAATPRGCPRGSGSARPAATQLGPAVLYAEHLQPAHGERASRPQHRAHCLRLVADGGREEVDLVAPRRCGPRCSPGNRVSAA